MEYIPGPKLLPEPLALMGFVDASYGGHGESCKSHTGMVMTTQSGIIHWRSSSQKTLTTSSSHAEAKAAFSMAKEMMSIKGLLAEMHPTSEASSKYKFCGRANVILVDNKATVDLLLEPKSQEKSRHWLLAYKWVNELQRMGLLRFRHVHGENNVSDLLTKPVTTQVYNHVMDMMDKNDWRSTIQYHEYEELGTTFD